jgi:hypothetical protein
MKPSRRQLLGMGGGFLALPLARPAPAQDGPGPKRLIVFHYPQGTVLSQFIPSGNELDFSLPFILQPLRELSERIVVVTGVDNAMPRYNEVSTAHPNANYTFLTCTPFLEQDDRLLSPAGPSIEQVIAQRISTDCPYQRLDFAIGGSRTPDGILLPEDERYFWYGPEDPVASFNDPAVAVSRLFGSAGADPADAWEQRAHRTAALRAVMDNFAGVRSSLPAGERARLDAHAEKVEQLVRRLSRAAGECSPPGLSLPYDYDYGYDDNLSAPAMCDLLVETLRCGYTKVATLSFANSHSHGFEWLWERNGGRPIVDPARWDNWHAMVHADPQEGMEVVFRWYMEVLASLLGKLDETEDGDGGSLLDSSLVLCISEFSSGRHWHNSLPIVLAGNLGGAPTGRWLDLMAGSLEDFEASRGSMQSGATMNQLCVSLLHAFGFDDPSFGYAPSELPLGPLPGLM